jgi:hypothetical protein
MIWSFSNHNIFRRCQRQWYYKNVHASWRAKDTLRQESWRLSKLQNINAWRGRIVDKVISDNIVPKINSGQSLPLINALKIAKSAFDSQRKIMFDATKDRKLVKVGNESYAGFYELEYGIQLERDNFVAAWAEIKKAITLFYDNTGLWDLMKDAHQLVPQRALTFKLDGSTIRAVPDIIGFFNGSQPMIIDWKVHSRAKKDYWLQLATYSIALAECNPHRDWISVPSKINPCEIELVEAQLLTNDMRKHSVSEEDIEDVEDLVSCSVNEISLAMDGKKSEQLKPDYFQAASNPKTCQFCNFRKICWEGD